MDIEREVLIRHSAQLIVDGTENPHRNARNPQIRDCKSVESTVDSYRLHQQYGNDVAVQHQLVTAVDAAEKITEALAKGAMCKTGKVGPVSR